MYLITTTLGTQGEIGTGMGLPLCQDIMVAHEGRIAVESVVGEGSTFSLPFSRTKPLILLVDDEKTFRIEQKSLLKQLNEIYPCFGCFIPGEHGH